MTRLAVAIAFLALNFYVYYFMARQVVIPPREAFESWPLEFETWHCPGREFIEPTMLENLGATDYVICEYNDAEKGSVSLYVGYHATQIREEGGGSAENSIHPPAHCLPGSGWDIIDSKDVPLDLPGLPQRPATVKRLVIAKGTMRQLVYYWYQTQGRVIADDWQKILFTGFWRATRGRTDGSLVRFTIPIVNNDEQQAERAFRDLAPLISAKLVPYIPT